jgi:peroxiredoxin
MSKVSKGAPLNNSDSFSISGVITGGELNNDSLQIIFWHDYIYGGTSNDALDSFIHIDENGRFNFEIPVYGYLGRIRMGCYRLGIDILEFQMVEPGDKIFMSITLRNNNPLISFSGKGCKKYIVNYLINHIKGEGVSRIISNPEKCIAKIDSIILVKIKILDNSRKDLTYTSYNVLRNDLIGEEYAALCKLIYWSSKEEKEIWKKKQLNNLLKIDTASAFFKQHSKGYTEFLFEKAKLELFFLFDGIKYEFGELYRIIKSTYTGLIKEKLLAYCLLDYVSIQNFGGIDADSFTFFLRNTYEITQTRYLKEAIGNKLMVIGKGATAFNFCLPNTFDSIFCLQDFVGKVVFIDIWSNPCTGCLLFKRAFEKEIYPKIDKNPQIIIISISTNKEKEKWLEGIKIYSNEDYINLYTGGKGHDHPLIKHYNITGLPYFLVIDKRGKIYSATVPLPHLGKGTELLSLLKNVLYQN